MHSWRRRAVELTVVAAFAAVVLATGAGAVPSLWLLLATPLVLAFVVFFGRRGTAGTGRGVEVEPAGKPPEPGDVFRFTSRYASALAASVPAVFAAMLVVAAVAAANAWSAAALAGAAVPCLLVWRGLHVSLELELDRAVIRNVYRTYGVRWSEVEAVGVGDDGVAFSVRGRRLAIEAAATAGRGKDPALLRELRRYAEPHGVRFDPELLQT